MLTLAQLLTPATRDQINSKILATLQSNGFPTTDWQPGGPEKTLIQAFAQCMLDYSATLLPTVVGGGLVDFATGAWLAMLAQEAYNLLKNAASFTLGQIILSCAAGAGPYTINAGDLWVQGANTSNKYNNTSGGTLRAPGFSAVTHTGPGTGTVTPGGTNSGGIAVTVAIAASGGLGVGTFTFGAVGPLYTVPTSAPIVIPGGGVYTDSTTGISITFAGTFTAGDTYTFSSFGLLALQWTSESPNNSQAVPPLNYVDAANSITILLTPKPSVTVNNPSPTYSAITQIGVGTGIVTPSGSPNAPHSVTVRIDVGGAVGSGMSWSTSLDGAGFVSQGTVANIMNLSATGINITLAGTFNAGDTYTFTAPGTWITQQGTDVEVDAALATRCKNRWPTLASIFQSSSGQTVFQSPTLGVYDLLVRVASSQVTQTLVQTDGTVNNRVNIYIAGQAGVLPAGIVAAVQAYLNPRVPLTDTPVVLSPVARAITVAGVTVTVKQAFLTTAQQSIQAALAAYINSTGINSSVSPIELSEIITLIRSTPGVQDVSVGTLTINGATANLTLPVTPGAIEVPSWTQLVATDSGWTWRTV